MNARILRKLAVLCLVVVLTGAAWAGCTKDGSACKKGDDKKACESKEKEGNGDKSCEKSESKSCEKAADKE